MNPDQHYTSHSGYQSMMAWYESAIAGIDTPIERHSISTRYGDTHVITAGSPLSPPLVLLHGTNVNALVWKAQIAPLAAHFHIIAPDVIGFAGRSAPVRLPYDGDGYALWLYDVLDALDIDRAVFVGSSAGGYFALKPAAYAPERCAGVILMNPCGLDHFRFPYTLFEFRIIADFVGWFGRRFIATRNTAQGMVRFSASPNIAPDDETVEMAFLLVKYYRRYHPPTPIATHELQHISAPVLLMMSEYEPFLNTQAVIRRAEQVFTDLTTRIIPNAGHDMNKEQPDLVMQAVLDFLNRIHHRKHKETQRF